MNDQSFCTQVGAGFKHTVPLRSGGSAAACGFDGHGQGVISALDDQLFCAQVAAGRLHTILL
jgi:hypothetical protein